MEGVIWVIVSIGFYFGYAFQPLAMIKYWHETYDSPACQLAIKCSYTIYISPAGYKKWEILVSYGAFYEKADTKSN
jgi:hypothetical protein